MHCSIKRVAGVLIAGALTSSALNAAAYIKFDGIDGESVDKGHEDWIQLDSISHSIKAFIDGPHQGTVEFPPAAVSFPLEKASPNFLHQLIIQLTIPNVILEITEDLGGEQHTFYQIHFEDATLLSLETGTESPNELPSDELTFGYNRIQWTYRVLDRNNSALLERHRANWDLIQNTGTTTVAYPPMIMPPGEIQLGFGEVRSVPIALTDGDTAASQLSLLAQSSDPDAVKVLDTSGVDAVRTIHLEASSLYQGAAHIDLIVGDGEFDTSSQLGILIGTDLSPFEAYLATHLTPGELADSSYTDPLGDPDLDDIPTLAEFYLGTHLLEKTDPQDALRARRENNAGERQLLLEYFRRTDVPFMSASFWISSDLVTWQRQDPVNNPNYEETAEAGQNPLYERVSVVITLPGGVSDHYYVRHEVDATF